MINPTGIVPTEFKCLILPKEVEQVSKGGIILSSQSVEAEKSATIEGEIIAVSPLAFSYARKDEWEAAGAEPPKPGQRVIFAKYAGMRHKAKDGQEYLLVNDKDIVATIEE